MAKNTPPVAEANKALEKSLAKTATKKATNTSTAPATVQQGSGIYSIPSANMKVGSGVYSIPTPNMKVGSGVYSVSDAASNLDPTQSILDQFMSNYTAALQNQYEAEQARLNQERANAQTSIMSNANVGGTLYSNLTGRDKVKYDTNTYLPGMQQAYTTYQTGLNDMRAKAAQLANTLKGYEEQSADTAYQMAQYQKQIDEQIAKSQAQAYSAYLTNTAQNTLYKDALKQNKDLKSALPGLA